MVKELSSKTAGNGSLSYPRRHYKLRLAAFKRYNKARHALEPKTRRVSVYKVFDGDLKPSVVAL